MSLDDTKGWLELVSERADFMHKHIKSGALEQYRNKPWQLIAAVEQFTKQNKVPMLISQAKMELIGDILGKMQPKPKVILEFGAYVGSSAVGWGAILRDLHGSDTQGVQVYAFELDPNIAECARDLVQLAGLADIVTVVDGSASDAVKQLHADGRITQGGVDMAFIDHWERYYVPDLQLCERLKLFHVGSVVCADNTDYPGAPTYLKYVQAGGSGDPAGVRYETETVLVAKEERQSVVEVSTVVKV